MRQLAEATRQLEICNACRYCEGYCAVFPALERRRTVDDTDSLYLANLCFECRACYYACPYTPPHEFAVNLPRVLAEVRRETYAQHTWPGVRSARAVRTAVAATALACCVGVPLAALAWLGTEPLSTPREGAGAFYAVVPYAAMVLPAVAMWLWAGAVLGIGAFRFWRRTRGRLRDLLDLRALVTATRDALGLEYLKGGGPGCSYPDARPSHARRWLHHLVFYGFATDLAATSLAAAYHHLLGLAAPYAYTSGPVVLGTLGGVAMIAGAGGLLALKLRVDPAPTDPGMVALDIGFLALLLWTNLTGLLLLALRETPAMGALLVIHLGAIAGLFLTLPYGKLAHVAYRYAALVQSSLEGRFDSPK
jgi:citrate/tricarballylate utilization protein